jgi:hypothetical protein
MLGRALLARIDRIPVNEARREEARLHFAHAEALCERLLRWASRMRPGAPAIDGGRVALLRRVTRP